MSSTPPRRILVLVGTDHHPFDRLVDWADAHRRRHPEDQVLIQYGRSEAPRLAEGSAFLTPTELASQVESADIVVTHGGPGTIADARRGGHRPLVVPRDPSLGEHVDDHQQRFARWAQERGMITATPTVDDLDREVTLLADTGTRGASSSGEGRAANVARVRALAEHSAGRRSAVPGSPLVLYIAGFGRSGSTLLECLLTRLPGVVALGELVHLWERGLRENQLCACGTPFYECPFWSAVGHRAFGGWENVDPDQVRDLKQAVDRQRRLPMTSRRHVMPRERRKILEYVSFYRRVFEAARQISGAEVLVDSSKETPAAMAYSHDRGIDLRVIHLVRDSRGVAFSWAKSVPRPETGSLELMPRFSARDATLLWMSLNSAVIGLRHRDVAVTRMRYEDLVEDPAAVVREAWRVLGLPGSGELPMIDRSTIELRATHSVAGNPMRFKHGMTTLRPDTAWRLDMDPQNRRLVTAMSWPHLLAYGYVGRKV